MKRQTVEVQMILLYQEEADNYSILENIISSEQEMIVG